MNFALKTDQYGRVTIVTKKKIKYESGMRARILHSGDTTGREIEQALTRSARAQGGFSLFRDTPQEQEFLFEQIFHGTSRMLEV